MVIEVDTRGCGLDSGLVVAFRRIRVDCFGSMFVFVIVVFYCNKVHIGGVLRYLWLCQGLKGAICGDVYVWHVRGGRSVVLVCDSFHVLGVIGRHR